MPATFLSATFKVNDPDAVWEHLTETSDIYFKQSENGVLEPIKLPIIKLSETRQGSVWVGVAVS